MLPRTKKGEQSHRLKKRRLEIKRIVSLIENYIKKHPSNFKHELNLLEFGCGSGFQIPYLQKLGAVTAIDVSISKNLQRTNQANYAECDISNSPFINNHFDLIFSNHVIEHVRDLDIAFDELKRIGKKNCLYALAVPTNVWLLLSIPAQYLQKLRAIQQHIKRLAKKDYASDQKKSEGFDFSYSGNSVPVSILLDKFKPHGHGSIRNFRACYQAFRKDSWNDLFKRHGFKVITSQPLLLYAPSEWPIIPIMDVKGKAKTCSSIVYLLSQN